MAEASIALVGSPLFGIIVVAVAVAVGGTAVTAATVDAVVGEDDLLEL